MVQYTNIQLGKRVVQGLKSGLPLERKAKIEPPIGISWEVKCLKGVAVAAWEIQR